MAWDVPGNLLRVTNDADDQGGIYAYDPLGPRVETRECCSTIFTAYTGTETLADQISPLTPSNDYLYASGILIAGDGAYYGYPNYYTTDSLGSVRLRTDQNKNVVFSDNYQPYGQDSGTPAGSDSYRFTSKGYSSNTGLYYEYQRWYDPGIGRFISQDSFAGVGSDPQSLNRYVYVTNTPTSLVDPSGALSEEEGSFHACGEDECVPIGWLFDEARTPGSVYGGAAELSPAELGGASSIEPITTGQLEPTTIEPTAGPGGIGSVELGKIGEGGTLGKLNAMGVNVQTEVESHPSIDLSNGDTVRPDFRVENSKVGFRGIIETKWGPLKYGNTRALQQFNDNLEISKASGLPLYYDLYSEPDLWWQDLFRMNNVRFL